MKKRLPPWRKQGILNIIFSQKKISLRPQQINKTREQGPKKTKKKPKRTNTARLKKQKTKLVFRN